MSLGPAVISKGKSLSEKQTGLPRGPWEEIRSIAYSTMRGIISYLTNKSHFAEPSDIHFSPATS